ncbi:MAG: ABC transporter ATP-binding protein [Chloroflexota bacterium]
MISLQGLTKKFGETVAVHNLAFDVNAGQVFGLIGPDGAGKTTTLRVISTAMNPTTGRVFVGGVDTTRDPEAVKKLIGYMPQRFALYPDLTVIENLNFFADLFGAPRADRAALIARLLGFARLTEFQTRLARNLSGGMQKKLALATTLMHTPRVLLLDEPTTGVDPVSRREFWDLLTEAHLQGRALAPIEERALQTEPKGESARKVTIVISTPYLDEAERCTRVGLMYRGELIACDEPRKLRDEMRAVVFEAQSADALRARKLIERNEGVLTVSTHGDLLRVLVDRAERAAAIQTAWQTNSIAVSDLRAVKPRLEDAFVLLLQKQEPK